MFARRNGRGRIRLEGRIAAAGFASGDRFVAGIWDEGPFGLMIDVMWAAPDGTRILLAPHAAAARFIGGIYSFDEVRVVPVAIEEPGDGAIEMMAGPLRLRLMPGPPNPLFGLRPRILRRSPTWIRMEDAVLRPLVGRLLLRGARGVRGYGVTPSGVREWYAIDEYRPLQAAAGELEGLDLGPLAPLDPPMRFGFSEFPHRPALVRCAPLLEGVPKELLEDPSPEAPAGGSRAEGSPTGPTILPASSRVAPERPAGSR